MFFRWICRRKWSPHPIPLPSSRYYFLSFSFFWVFINICILVRKISNSILYPIFFLMLHLVNKRIIVMLIFFFINVISESIKLSQNTLYLSYSLYMNLYINYIYRMKHTIFVTCLPYFCIIERKAEILFWVMFLYFSSNWRYHSFWHHKISVGILHPCNSSQTLHNKMLLSILRAPVLFFNRNPIGKSDTKFLGKYVFLIHLVPDYIWYMKMDGDLRGKLLWMLICLLQKALLIF